MRKILLFGITVLLLTGCMTAKFVSYDEPISKIIEVEGKSKDKLFVDANNWMVSVFKSAESVIEFSDKEEGAIIGKYLMGGSASTPNGWGGYIDTRVYAKINIWAKEGRVKIDVIPNDFSYYSSEFVAVFDKEAADVACLALITDFEEAIAKQSESDW